MRIIKPDSLAVGSFGGNAPSAILVYSAQSENVATVLEEGHRVTLEEN
ncbi:hypothetical protein [Pantoea piersonii]